MSRESAWRSAARAWVVRKVVETLGLTYRLVDPLGAERLSALRESGEPAIISFWHNRILYCSYHLRNRLASRGYPLKVMISRSQDGELIARVIKAWGVDSARGSSSSGGGRALRELVRELGSTRGSVVTTPDGPRGPVYEAQAGTVLLAQLAGVPIYPMSSDAERCWRLGSWDRFLVPKPFSRVSVAVGEPLFVPRALDEEGRETARQALGRALRAADAAARAVFGSTA